MLSHRSVVRAAGLLIVVVGVVATTAAPAAAFTVVRKVDVSTFDVHWSCPGRNPVEHATTTVRIIEFRAGGVRIVTTIKT